MNNDVELIPVKGVSPSVQVQSDNVIYVPQAHKNKAGIVKEGDGVLIENGVVSLNRQTVEDMIDANKWVSYGFQQNLTEDEKGMARHNIGAGDNYFTGSYYDLTQKPHLNTNNTTGLDYGDEELNDTINLHKISKTGSFNDLKHVPQETIDFAELERQKSKNLFDTTKAENVGYNWNGTINSNNSQNYISCGFIKIKPNTNYIFSLADSTITMQYTGALFYTLDKTYISYVECNGNTFITPSNAEYMICQFWFESNPMNYKDIIQIEEGSVATNYQPYNGQITHNGDAPVVFAESERQKSKNLLYIKNTQNTTTITSYPDHIILNGTPNANTEYPYTSSTLPNDVEFEQGKTYTLSRQLISGNGGLNFKLGLVLQDTNGQPLQEVVIPSGQESFTLVCNSNNIKKYSGYIIFDGGVTFTNAYYGLQIEEGSVATNYQPYNGQITHNGDAPVVFAESERQKSKNLFDYTKIKSLNYGITQADNVFTINTQFYYPSIDYDINLNQGETYTFSLNIDSYSNSDGSGVNSEIILFNAEGSTDTKGVGGVSSIGRYSITFTPEFNVVSVEIRPIRKGNNTSTLTGTVSNLMICTGEDRDYQPYNGAIVHEKEIAPILIYDINEKQTPTGLTSAYTSGIKFADGVNIPIGDFNYFNIYTMTKNNVKKKTTITNKYYYWGDSFFGFHENWQRAQFGITFIIENNSLSMVEAGYTTVNTYQYINKNQSEDVVVYRIEGGY